MLEARRVLRGDRVLLRPLASSDLRRCVKWFSDPQIIKFLGRDAPVTLAEEERWFRDYERRTDEQKRLATAYIQQLDAAHIFPRPIVTQVVPLKGFYRAEDYHQDYALHNPDNPYILVCDRPKIEALKQQFPDLFVDYKGSK